MGEEYGVKCNSWSMGALIFEMWVLFTSVFLDEHQVDWRSSRLWNIPVFYEENTAELFESIMNADFTFPEDDLGNVSEESCFPVFASIYLHSLREINSHKRDWRTACGQRGGQNDSCWVSGQWVDLVKWFEKLSTFQQQIFTIIYKTGRQVKNARKVWSNIQ